MTDEERQSRIGEFLAREAGEPQRWWWLSFCDETKPKGKQFVGACLVRASGFISAVRESHVRGCNPGGQVVAVVVPAGAVVPVGYANRVLTREEAESDEVNGIVRPGDN